MANLPHEVEPPEPVPDPLVWEQEKWRAEYELKRREVELKDQAQQKSTWSSPLVVAILAAAVAGLSSAVVAVINGGLQRDIEQQKAEESLRIEESRSEATRILEAIKTNGPDKAADNLQFLIDTGLISNKERVAQIQAFLVRRPPGTGPFLPAADGQYKFEQSEALTKSVATTLQRSLNEYIAYLGGLGFKHGSEIASIRIEKSVEGQPAAYPYYDGQTIHIDEAIADDVDMPRHEYTHHVLFAEIGAVDNSAFRALEMGISWYFPCSFAGRPAFGIVAARGMKVPQREIGDFGQLMQFAPPAKGDANYLYMGGAMWGSLLWEIRRRIGQQSADMIVVQAWANSVVFVRAWQNAAPPDKDRDNAVVRQFGEALVNAAASISPDAPKMIGKLLKERGFAS
jgi:hypothetical protein